jgi:hypothetical protein
MGVVVFNVVEIKSSELLLLCLIEKIAKSISLLHHI